jgi:exodeoxyribonuclease VII small subunit
MSAKTDEVRESGEELRFGEALEELEAILRRVEEEEIDIDSLAEELRRAAELLEVCRGKIKKAEVEVTQIVQSLEDEEPDET